MNLKHVFLAVMMGIAITGSAFAGTVYIEKPQVRTIVTDAGYGDPVLIERDGEIWRVKSLDQADKVEVTLYVTQDGKILGASDIVESRIGSTVTTTVIQPLPEPLSESSVATIVMNAGFHNVHDIDYLSHRGVWKAEADDITGEDFELHINPETGMIVHIEDD